MLWYANKEIKQHTRFWWVKDRIIQCLRGVDTWHHTKGCLIPVLQGKHGSYIAA